MVKKPTYEELEQRVKELEDRRSGHLELDLAALFHGFEDSFPVGITDHKGIILYVNKAIVETWGYTSPEEIIGRQLTDFWEGPGIFRTMEALATKGWAVGEDIGKRKDDSLFPVEFKAIMCEDIDGKPLYMLGQFFDISEQKKAQEAQRESEERYRRLIRNITDFIYSHDLEGRFLTVNRAAAKTLGYTTEDLIGLPISDFMLPEHRQAFKENYLAHIKEKGSSDGVTIYVARDGSRHYIEYRNVLVKQEGMEQFVTGSGRDITERILSERKVKKLREQLHRSQRMESIGIMAGGVAHDLNNVLSGIVSYPDLILMDLPEDSKLRKPIETMKESGQKAAAVVQDLLTVARGVATTKEPLNLNDIIRDCLNSPEFKKLKQFHPTVTVKTNLDSDILNVSGSRVHIGKVVMNLLSNASEAIEGIGKVTISTMNRYIDRPLREYNHVNIGEYAVLSVTDDGLGISSDDVERIFEPFYTKKVMGRSGTGLGLTVVWNTVQDHNGYINVSSDDNGTTFELSFPITKDDLSDKDMSIPINDIKGNGETILVVDDVKSQREISCKMLETLGYKTRAVSSGEEAVEYVKEHTVDLILLDMIMDPGINGRETYEKIIKIHPKQKAIIVSGFAETDDVNEAQKLGAGKYIKKPFTLEKIGLDVKEELEK